MNRKMLFLKKEDRLTAFVFLLCAVCSISMVFFGGISKTISYIEFIVGILGLLGFSVFGKKEQETTNGNGMVRIYNENDGIKRAKWYPSLMDEEKLIILSGESGCGKTVIINQFKKFLKDINIPEKEIKLLNDDYYLDLSHLLKEDELSEYKYVVFDQFEAAMKTDRIDQHIDIITTLRQKGIHVIVAVRKEALGELYYLLDSKLNGASRIEYITNTDLDETDIMNYLEKANHSIVTKHESTFSKLVDDFIKGKMTFIQLREIARAMASDKKDLFKHQITDYNQLIKENMKSIIGSCSNANVVWEVLYLLALGYQSLPYMNNKDFQNIALLKESEIHIIIEFLENTKWVLKTEKADGNDKAVESFEVSHDYYRDLIVECAQELLDAQVCKGIYQYYVRRKNNEHQQMTEATEGSKKTLDYIDQVNKKSSWLITKDSKERRLIRATLRVFLLIMAFLAAMKTMRIIPDDFILLEFLLPNTGITSYYLELTLLLINLGLSVVYVYNVYYYLLMYNYKHLWGIITGLLACIGCLLQPAYWGIFLGLEVSFIGLIMLGIWRTHKDDAIVEGNYKTKGGNYILMGCIIMFMGLLYISYVRQNLLFMATFFLAYGLFISFTIRAQINSAYFRSIIGKVLYDL